MNRPPDLHATDAFGNVSEHDGSGRPIVGDAITGAAQEVWDMLVGAVTDPGPWSYAAMVLAAVVTILPLRAGLRSFRRLEV